MRGAAVYAAHRDTHFRFPASDVATGDEIEVTRRDGGHFRFRVTGTSVVRWDASGIDPLADGRRLALVTCWPLDGKFSGPLRYVVHAELVLPPCRPSVSKVSIGKSRQSRRTIPHLSAQRGRRQGAPWPAVAEQSRT